MKESSIDARTFLESLVDRQIRAPGKTVTVLEVREDVAVVRTSTGHGRGRERTHVEGDVRIDRVQRSIDRLTEVGKARADESPFEPAIVFDLLAKLPGAVWISDGPTLIFDEARLKKAAAAKAKKTKKAPTRGATKARAGAAAATADGEAEAKGSGTARKRRSKAATDETAEKPKRSASKRSTRASTKAPAGEEKTAKQRKRATGKPTTRAKTKAPEAEADTAKERKRATGKQTTRAKTKAPAVKADTAKQRKRPTGKRATRAKTKAPAADAPPTRDELTVEPAVEPTVEPAVEPAAPAPPPRDEPAVEPRVEPAAPPPPPRDEPTIEPDVPAPPPREEPAIEPTAEPAAPAPPPRDEPTVEPTCLPEVRAPQLPATIDGVRKPSRKSARPTTRGGRRLRPRTTARLRRGVSAAVAGAGSVVRRAQLLLREGESALRINAPPLVEGTRRVLHHALHVVRRLAHDGATALRVGAPPALEWAQGELRRARRILGAHGPWPPVLLASCAAVTLTTWGWTASPARAAVTTWFLLVCPGLALVRLLPFRGLLTQAVLAVAASLALETCLAEIALETHTWSQGTTLGELLVIALAAQAVELSRASRADSAPHLEPEVSSYP